MNHFKEELASYRVSFLWYAKFMIYLGPEDRVE